MHKQWLNLWLYCWLPVDKEVSRHTSRKICHNALNVYNTILRMLIISRLYMLLTIHNLRYK